MPRFLFGEEPVFTDLIVKFITDFNLLPGQPTAANQG
jgi:hypothetical protein